MCLTLGSASLAQSAHGDESVPTSVTLDATTMPILSAAELAEQDQAIVPVSSNVATSSEASSTPTTTNIATSSVADSNNTASQSGSDQIQTYTVKSGDTLSEIAHSFHISVNTIVWANSINSKSSLKDGQTLVILPISGVEYTVKSGDNLQSIANKFKGDVDEIVAFNNLEDSSHVKAGDIIIIPDGDLSSLDSNASPSKPASKPSSASSAPSVPTKTSSSDSTTLSGLDSATGLLRPIVGGVKTQGIHGHNAVDLADSLNTPILAAAAGTVIVAKTGGWNGGYGNYVVIDHHNGIQTLYAHMNSLNTSVGSTVSQGQTIGFMGETGDATGVHVHFEVRGGVNPF